MSRTTADAGSLLGLIVVDGPLVEGVLENRLLHLPRNAVITSVRAVLAVAPSGDDFGLVMQEFGGGDPHGLPLTITDGNTEPPTSDPITNGTPLLLLSGAYEFDVTSAAGAEGLHLAVFGGLLA